MANSKNEPEGGNTEEAKPTKPKKNARENGTMLLQLIDSKGKRIIASGKCTDKEIKQICRALNHTPDQTIEVK